MKPPLVFRPYTPTARDIVYRDTLPHRSCPGRTIFITWRLSDSIPPDAAMEKSLHRAQKRWLERERVSLWPESQNIDDILLNRCPEKVSSFRLIRYWVEEQFDSKRLGASVLKDSEAAASVRSAIFEEEKSGVGIGDFAISWNHVHLLLVMGQDADLQGHMTRIKGRASCYLGRAGVVGLPKPVWQRHWFDHIVRNRRKLTRIRAYIADHRVPCGGAYYAAEWA